MLRCSLNFTWPLNKMGFLCSLRFIELLHTLHYIRNLRWEVFRLLCHLGGSCLICLSSSFIKTNSFLFPVTWMTRSMIRMSLLKSIKMFPLILKHTHTFCLHIFNYSQIIQKRHLVTELDLAHSRLVTCYSCSKVRNNSLCNGYKSLLNLLSLFSMFVTVAVSGKEKGILC